MPSEFEPSEIHRTKNLIFVEEERKASTSVFRVYSAHDESMLAEIRWHGPWRQYVMSPYDETIWSDGCLADLVQFMTKIRALRKEAKTGGCANVSSA